MKNFAARLLLAFLFLAPVAAHAQSTGRVVADCTTGVPLAYGPGTTSMMTMLPTGAACVNASVVASIAGFAPATTGTPITATTGGDTGTLPAGAVVIATNVGTTNAAYCKLGASATTADQYLSPNGGWFAFTVGVATQLTCITSTSTTVVNMTGGAGIATGTGGGGGGSGGAVTQSGTWTVQPGNTANTTPWLVEVDNTLAAITMGDGITTGNFPSGSPVFYGLFNGTTYDRPRSGGVTGMQGVSIQASPTGGCTPNTVIAAGASTNATSVKASAGTLCDWAASNTTTTLYYVHFYNNAGSPTCNTGIIESYPIPAATATGQVGGWSRPLPQGHAYGTGIGICITANADGTGNAAAGVLLNIGYK